LVNLGGIVSNLKTLVPGGIFQIKPIFYGRNMQSKKSNLNPWDMVISLRVNHFHNNNEFLITGQQRDL